MIHSSRPAGSDHYFRLKIVLCDFEKWGRTCTYVQTTRAKIVITTGRDCWSTSWIKKENPHEKEKVSRRPSWGLGGSKK